MYSLNTFGARTSHRQPQIHKIHHNPDLGETTTFTFPFIIYYVPLHEAHIQMTFCLEIHRIETPTILGAHNFVCKPSIEMKYEAKL
jgi:hypothetical protein